MTEGQARTIALTFCGVSILGLGAYFGIFNNSEINKSAIPDSNGTGAGARSSEATSSDESIIRTETDQDFNLSNKYSHTATVVAANDPTGRNRQCATIDRVVRPTNQLAFILAAALKDVNYPDVGEVVIYQSGQKVEEFNTNDGMPPNSLLGITSNELVACSQN